jgi:hypothetical protein
MTKAHRLLPGQLVVIPLGLLHAVANFDELVTAQHEKLARRER